MTFRIRPYHPNDAPALLALFRDTIRRVNIHDYSPEQIQAWASDDIDLTQWTARFADRFAVVAEAGDPLSLAGFTELEPDGHIDRFYVSADHQRRGIGRALMVTVFQEADRQHIPRLFTEASITARPFFESQGFEIIAPQTVVVRDVEFRNYRMSRNLN